MSKKKKRKSTPVQTKAKDEPMIIKIDKVPLGHQEPISGVGAHDHREKRKRTRGAATRSAINEFKTANGRFFFFIEGMLLDTVQIDHKSQL